MSAILLSGNFLAAGVFHHTLKVEKEWLAGGNDTLPASIAQVALLATALGQLALYYKVEKRLFLSNKVITLITLSPIAWATLETSLPNGHCRRAVQLISYNIGILAQGIFAYATLSLLRSKKYALVLTSCAGYGSEILLNRQAINYKYRKEIKKVLSFAYFAYLFLGAETLFQKGMGACCLVGRVESLLKPYLYGNCNQTNVDPAHLSPPPKKRSGPSENFPTKIQNLKDKFNQIDWEKHRRLIEHTVAGDDHWNNPYYAREGSDAVAFFKEGFEILVHRIGGKQEAPPPTLEIRKSLHDIVLSDPEQLKMLQEVLEKICDQNDPAPETFIMLGVNAANYCSSRLLEVFDQLDRDLFEADAETILYNLLREKQMFYLHKLRRKEMEGKWWKPHWYRTLLGKDTPQQRNYYRFCYGEPIGIPLGAASNDITLDRDLAGAIRLFFSYWVMQAKKRFFEEYYTEENIIKWIKETKHRFQSKGCLSGTLSDDQIRSFLVQNKVLKSLL